MQARRIVRTLSLTIALVTVTAIVMGQSVVVTVTSDGTKATVSVPDRPPPDPRPHEPKIPVDLVICLDTSGSMTQLIDSARAKLWDVVNELARAKPTPYLRVGLLTYGSPNLSTAAQGWVVRHTDLTSDLDTVYAKMMAMRTNGGEEYVGWVLNDALNTMSWSREPSALKVIFVAGNESADQGAGTFNFRYVAEDARSRGIIINSIYAGDHRQGINERWDQVASHGGGCYAAIDMHAGTIQIPTRQDKILIELNAELNATYVPYGPSGRKGKANQTRQDANAATLGEQSVGSRITAKASKLYNNSHWDLVDAEQQEGLEVAKLKKEDLPAEMREMTVTQQRTYIEKKRTRRSAVREKIRRVSAEREEYLRQARQKAGSGQTSLDQAMKEAIRQQAQSKNFQFNN